MSLLCSCSQQVPGGVQKFAFATFEKKAMTNLHSILKSRDITLLTKAHIVKAIVFLVVICRCECWTIKKAEH